MQGDTLSLWCPWREPGAVSTFFGVALGYKRKPSSTWDREESRKALFLFFFADVFAYPSMCCLRCWYRKRHLDDWWVPWNQRWGEVLTQVFCILLVSYALRSWEQTLNPMKWEWTRETEAFSSSSLPPILPPSFRRLSLSEKDKEWRISSEKCHCPHMPRTPWHEIQSHSS